MNLMEVVRFAWGRVVSAWTAAQVELHGKYSIERTHAFFQYSAHVQWQRILLWSIITPLPCLFVNTVMDFAPLAKPSEGRDANYVFWIRDYFMSFIITYGIHQHFSHLAPSLGYSHRQVVVGSFLVNNLCVAFEYALAGVIAFPVPFMYLAVTPVFVASTWGVLLGLFWRKLRDDRAVRTALFRAVAVVHVLVGLTVEYPVFIHGFQSLPPRYQNPYMILLPLIKLVARNTVSKVLGNNDDVKPEVVIFSIEVFNALYVSLAMGSATSWSTSLLLIAMDVIHAWISVHDVHEQVQRLNELLPKVSRHVQSKGNCQLKDVAIALLSGDTTCNREESGCRDNNIVKNVTHKYRVRNPRFSLLMGKRYRNKVSTIPSLSRESSRIFVKSTRQLGSAATNSLHEHDRAEFIHLFSKTLFAVEFIILIEYTEIIIPAFYSIYMTAMFYLPNREFYPTLADIDENRLQRMVANVLLYAFLELVSFVGIVIVLRRMTGVSPLHQLAFVLEKQWGMVQYKLLAWVFYAVQNSLEHIGADFSFQFKWLHSGK